MRERGLLFCLWANPLSSFQLHRRKCSLFLAVSFCGKVCHYLSLTVKHFSHQRPHPWPDSEIVNLYSTASCRKYLPHVCNVYKSLLLPLHVFNSVMCDWLVREQRLKGATVHRDAHILKGGFYLQLTTLVGSRSLMTCLETWEALSHCGRMPPSALFTGLKTWEIAQVAGVLDCCPLLQCL